MRLIPIELQRGGIDGTRSRLNVELVPMPPEGLQAAVLTVVADAGIDMAERKNKRVDKGVAVEWLFTLSVDYVGDDADLFGDCLAWLKSEMPDCPIIHAVIHRDEGAAHMHVISVPIMGGRLQATAIIGYKAISNARNRRLAGVVGVRHGLSEKHYLKGALKQAAAKEVRARLARLSDADYRKAVQHLVDDAVSVRPEGFMQALGVLPPVIEKKSRSAIGIMTGVGHKTSEDKERRGVHQSGRQGWKLSAYDVSEKATPSCVGVVATTLRSCGGIERKPQSFSDVKRSGEGQIGTEATAAELQAANLIKPNVEVVRECEDDNPAYCWDEVEGRHIKQPPPPERATVLY